LVQRSTLALFKCWHGLCILSLQKINGDFLKTSASTKDGALSMGRRRPHRLGLIPTMCGRLFCFVFSFCLFPFVFHALETTP
jgi:hypothetical protein